MTGFLLENFFLGGKTIDHCFKQYAIVSIVIFFTFMGGNNVLGYGKSHLCLAESQHDSGKTISVKHLMSQVADERL